MRLIFTAIAVLFSTAALAVAQSADARKSQVDAAVSNAVTGLYTDISHTSLSSRLTVADLLDKVAGRDDLIHTLQTAQEIGGPRWLDDQTAQVRLEIAGGNVARTLLQLAASNPKKTPISANALAAILADWDRRTFAAVGTSTGSSALVNIQPAQTNRAWAGVPDADRKQAISAAHANAAQQTIDALRSIDLKPSLTIAQSMDRTGSPMRADLDRFLRARPVNSVSFRDDGQVEVTISTPAGDLTDLVRASVNATHDPHLIDIDWPHVRQQIDAKTGAGVAGIALIRPPQTPATAVSNVAVVVPVKLPDQPPDWVWKQLDADGAARGGDSPLKCARVAERSAVEKLRTQIDALPIGSITLGDAARKDPNLADAITRGLSHARVFKSDYHADGTVVVSVSLDLREFWAEIHPF
ncbi:MAG TPA: hypothetical protein VFE58_03705 [Tepidisphaeraceae bacterium]|jgi:hypothetical protein|nr:hypothetical protein [Tepidisphaeraceae bacterium]